MSSLTKNALNQTAVLFSLATIFVVAATAVVLWVTGTANQPLILLLTFIALAIHVVLQGFRQRIRSLRTWLATEDSGSGGQLRDVQTTRPGGSPGANENHVGPISRSGIKGRIIFGSLTFQVVLLLSSLVLVVFFLYGRQFAYASIWGDVGVYANVAAFFHHGGAIPLEWAANVWDLGESNFMEPPRGMINPAPGGGFQFHGLPTWPALMAVSGLEGDGKGILALLYVLCVFLFFVNAVRLIRDGTSALLGTIAFGALPLLWHQALYPTAELLMLGIALSGLTLAIIGRPRPLALGVCVFAFGAVHTSVLILVPIIGFVLAHVGVWSGIQERRVAAISAIAVTFGSLLALAFASTTSAVYTRDILAGLFGAHEYLAIVACLAPLMGTVPWLIERAGATTTTFVFLREMLYRSFPYLAGVAILGIVFMVSIKAHYLGWTDYYIPEVANPLSSWSARGAYANQGFSSIWHLSVVNIALATAGLGMVGWLVFLFSRQKTLELVMLWWVAFAMMVVFGVVRLDIPNNFYASRYFLPVLVPSLMLFTVFLFAYKKWTRWLLVPVLLWAAHVNSEMLGARFFATDWELVEFLEKQMSFQEKVVFSGSDWLRYHMVGVVLRNRDFRSEEMAEGDEWQDLRGPVRVVTDRDIVSGAGECLEVEERRIPWQISYRSQARLVDRTVCAYTGYDEGTGTVDLGSNRWLVGGGLEFLVLRPLAGERVAITFHSQGWWAGKEPFVDERSALEPTLTVCGERFALVHLSERRVNFEGVVPNSVCQAKLSTATFVPAEIGDGSDTRMLGMDVHAIEVGQAAGTW